MRSYKPNMGNLGLDQLLIEMESAKDLLIIQDLDGVCIPLVKDPLTRRLDPAYVTAARKLEGNLSVLTNGEHEGRRGVNRLVEKALGNSDLPAQQGLYLPGLAAGGVQLQDRFGVLSHPGVSDAEIAFLTALPNLMQSLLEERLSKLMPLLNTSTLKHHVQLAVLDTQVSPTINLNGLFSLVPDDVRTQQALQTMLQELMDELLVSAANAGLTDSFFLHVAPNMGSDGNRERIKPAVCGDVGTTDIQFLLKGALKEAGLLVLINRHIARHHGIAPLGEDFNVRTAPTSHEELLALCNKNISADQMPLLVGVGDTVTSNPCPDGMGWLRGGSDRGFLTLLQDLGKIYNCANRVVLVDSSGGEVDRPNLLDANLKGISDPEDPLSFDVLVPSGPKGYVKWFESLAERRACKYNMQES